MYLKGQPSWCHSRISSLRWEARSRADPLSQILIDSGFILRISSAQDDDTGTNPSCWAGPWRSNPALTWCFELEKQSRGCCSWIWGILGLFICSYVSSRISSLRFAFLLSDAVMQVCSTLPPSDRVSATSCFGLLRNHERGCHLAVRIFNPEAALFILAHACLAHGWEARSEAAAHRSLACPSYWHLVWLYQLLIRQCSRTASVQISMQKERGLLPALVSKCRKKPSMLAFPSVIWDHIFLGHKNDCALKK